MRPATLLLAALALSGCERPSPADLVIIGRVWTGDSLAPRADAIAIRGDRVVYVGDSAGALGLGGRQARVIRGAFMAPGFGDAHTHFIDGGIQLASVDLRSADTPQEFTRRIKAYVSTLAPGEWVTQGMWDHEAWGGWLPDRSWIDSVTPKHPVWVHNLRVNPKVEIRDLTVVQPMQVREVTDAAERARLWKAAVTAYPPYEEYQTRTTRMIPIFVAGPVR